VVLVATLGCHPAAPVAPAARDCTSDAIRASVQRTIEHVRATDPASSGWLVALRAPRLGVDVQLAVGAPDANATFRLASVTKTFTAAAILRLVEDRRLGLDDPLASALPAPYPELLRAGAYDPDKMTVRHLLNHTSGLWDHVESGSDDPSKTAYFAAVAAQPTKRWSREDQVRFAIEHGKPVAAPGELFSYSDTGYVLLGAILEARTGTTWGAALRALLDFDRLGLRATWLESIDPPPAAAPAHAPQTYNHMDLFAIDPSADLWGGGGLLSNTRDLAVFYDALFRGHVFHKAATLAVMEAMPRVTRPNRESGLAGMGIFRSDHATGVRCWHHEGYWGAMAVACPALEVSLAFTGLEAPEDTAPASVNQVFVDTVTLVKRCDALRTARVP
jgi:D-alanyl-D-alanine carboxypeptidase